MQRALWNAANPIKVLDWRESQTAAEELGLKLQSLEVRRSADFDRAFEIATRDRADALIVFSDGLGFINGHPFSDDEVLAAALAL